MGAQDEEESDDRSSSRWSSKALRAQIDAGRAGLHGHVRATRAQIDQANEKITERTGRNLVLAILIGLLLGGLMFVSLVVVKELFIGVSAVLLGFTSFELAASLRHAGRLVPRFACVASTVLACVVSYFFGAAGLWTALFVGSALVAVWTAIACRIAGRSLLEITHDIFAGLLVQLYVTFLGSFAVVLTAQEGGQWWTVAFLILVIATDVGAYASGLLFGRRPLAPSISPNKTWEGFCGGLVAGIVAGVILSVFMLGEAWWFGIIFGSVLFATGTLGDLIESLMKRDLGIKDMSSWLPGHGGFLDRFDSILPSAAAAYTMFLLVA